MIQNDIITRSTQIEYIQQLDKLLLEIHGVKSEKLMEYLQRDFTYTFLNYLQSFLDARSLTLHASKSSLESALQDLKKQLLSYDLLEVHMSFVPSELTLEKMYARVYPHVGENVLLDIKNDPEVIAGARIIYKGRYIDFSLGTKLKEIYKQ